MAYKSAINYKTITAEDLIEAAEKNGFIHARGAWFRTSKGERDTRRNADSETNPIIAACFMGQLAINLGVNGYELKSMLDTYYGNLGSDVIHWNDTNKSKYSTILKRFKTRIADKKSSKNKIVLSEATYYAKRKDSA